MTKIEIIYNKSLGLKGNLNRCSILCFILDFALKKSSFHFRGLLHTTFEKSQKHSQIRRKQKNIQEIPMKFQKDFPQIITKTKLNTQRKITKKCSSNQEIIINTI